MLLEKGGKKSIIAQNHIETYGLRNQVVISWQVINEVSANKFARSCIMAES
jgi:predicted nucleic acid-binding protein